MPRPRRRAEPPVTVDAALLRAWPLAGHDRPKSGRGTCLVVGGAASTPGSVALAATAALRAGAGKVQVATTRSTAAALAVALPELLVVGLDEDREGDLVPEAAAALRLNAEQASVVLVGPGCLGETSASALLARVAALPSQAALVVDGHALPGLARSPQAGPEPRRPRAPHAQPRRGPGAGRRWRGCSGRRRRRRPGAALPRGSRRAGRGQLDRRAGRARVVRTGSGPRAVDPGLRRRAGGTGQRAARTHRRPRRRRPSTACTSTPRRAVAWQPASVRWATWPGSCPGSSRRCSTRWHRGAASAPSATPRRAPRRTPGPPGVGGAAAARPPSPT